MELKEKSYEHEDKRKKNKINLSSVFLLIM